MAFKKSEIIFYWHKSPVPLPSKNLPFSTSHDTNTVSIGASLSAVLDVYLALQSSHRSQGKHQM